MKHIALLAALAAFLIANQSANAQGALNPPGAPAESQKSLLEIYDAIQSARADFETAKAEFATLVQQAVPSVPGMVTVLGGTLPENSELAGEVVSTFYIGKYEVTWDEWQEIRAWAVTNGYSDLADVGAGSAGDHPVHSVSWYDVVKWMNARSEKEGLAPVYQVGGAVYKTGQSVPTINSNANGYRLPLEKEWEWAARGGVRSKGYTYSGSNDVNSVAWYLENSSSAAVNMWNGKGTWPVGQKEGNEIGIHDMSGNLWEWCEDIINSSGRLIRGGDWNGIAGYCAVAYRDFYYSPDYVSAGIGIRLARSY